MVFLTGDTHGNVTDLRMRIFNNQVPEGSTIVILGDAGWNYWLNNSDSKRKAELATMPYTFLNIHGNHEARPWEVEHYLKIEGAQSMDGATYYQKAYPNVLFLDDGIHYIEDKKYLVLGGAYSVDKDYRLKSGGKWWDSEQMSIERRNLFLNYYIEEEFETILTHTCPYMARPLDKGLSFVDNATVDNSMEVFLEHFRQQNTYKKWYAGHWHIDEIRKGEEGEIHFLFWDMVKV